MRLGLIFTGGDSTVHELATIAGQAVSRSGEVLKSRTSDPDPLHVENELAATERLEWCCITEGR